MQGRCDKHPFEIAEDRCGRCGHEYCPECLVYSFGANRPPFCIPCAVASAGIRSSARGSLPRKEQKRIEKERKLALKAAKRADKEVLQPTGPVPQPAEAIIREPSFESAFDATSERGALDDAYEPGFVPFAAG